MNQGKGRRTHSRRAPGREPWHWRDARAPVVLCCLLFWGLYLCELGSRPLWWDEGFTVYTATQPLADLVRVTAADFHPPAHYLLLKMWTALAGTSPFSVRCFSAAAGLLVVPLLYACGHRLSGNTAGVLAAALGGGAPFLVRFAREARMYSLGMALVAASSYAFVRVLGKPRARVRWWALYTISTGLGLYTQYAFVLATAAQAAGLLAVWSRKTGLAGRWLAALSVVLAAYVPWLAVLGPQLQRMQEQRVAGSAVSRAIENAFPIFQHAALGHLAADDLVAGLTIGCFVVLGLAGIWRLFRHRPGQAVFLALGVVGAVFGPAAVEYSAEEGLRRVLKLAFAGVPLLQLLAASGASFLLRVRRGLGLLVLVLVAVGLGRANLRSLTREIDASEDYRPVVAQVRALARPGDAVLTTYVWQDGYFESYVPSLAVAFYRKAYTARTASNVLGSVFEGHRRVWVVNYKADIHRTSEAGNAWLHRNAAIAFEEWYGRTQLSLFVRGEETTGLELLEQVAFERDIVLEYAPVSTSMRPGDAFGVTLRWVVGAPLDTPYQAFVHLGRGGAAPVAQTDAEPVDGLEPTDEWVPGQVVVDHRALLVPVDAPAGAYGLYVGIYDPDTGERLMVRAPSGCDEKARACVGSVQISAAAASGEADHNE